VIEKRKYPRFELKVNAKYRVISCDEAWRHASTRNISAEGLCFEAGEKLNTGTHVELEVDLEDNELSARLVGEIKWSSEIKGPKGKEKIFLNGMNLINIPASDESRFLKYYCDKMVQKLSGYLKI